MRRTLPVLLLVGLSACGGGGGAPTTPVAPLPTPSPTPPPFSATPVFFDGVTGTALAAEIDPASPASGQPVVVTAPGYLRRQQLFTGTPFQLWPATEDYVREFAFTEFSDGSYRTTKWARPFAIALSPSLVSNDFAVARTREVMAEVQRVTGMAVTLGSPGSVVIRVDPTVSQTDGRVGEARLRYNGATIVGADLVFVSLNELVGTRAADYTNTLLHEMGHALGLGHSTDPGDVMSTESGPGETIEGYSEREAAALRMMYIHRPAGTFFPDRDPGVAAASSARPLRTVIRD